MTCRQSYNSILIILICICMQREISR